LVIQQSQISITLGQQITMATSMDELLMNRTEKTKQEYKTLKHHQKELAATNIHLAKELSRVQTSLEQVTQLEQQVWTKHRNQVLQAEQDHKATFDAMLERAKTHSLATLEEKVFRISIVSEKQRPTTTGSLSAPTRMNTGDGLMQPSTNTVLP
jgi:predicted RNase H-like nuclease (RuvC/YqgF family)